VSRLSFTAAPAVWNLGEYSSGERDRRTQLITDRAETITSGEYLSIFNGKNRPGTQ
jgi:hypothetical protein